MSFAFWRDQSLARATILASLIGGIVSCTPQALPTAQPTPVSPATVAPPPAATVEPPLSPAPSPVPLPTQTAIVSAQPLTLTLWYALDKGSPDEQALTQALAEAVNAKPGLTVSVTRISVDQIFSRFAKEVASGAGPDLLLASDDELGTEVRSKQVQPVDAWVQGNQTDVSPVAIAGLTLNGHQWGIPAAFKVVALMINTDKVKTAPASTADLLKAVKAGAKIGINPNCFHNYGWYAAFGGAIFDGSFNTALDKAEGTTAAFAFLKELKQAAGAANFYDDGNKADAAFALGKLDMIVNGSWALRDYRKALGAKVLVAPMPAGPKGPAAPLVGVDGFFINATTKQAAAAAALALQLTNKDNQLRFAETAGWVPVRADLNLSDPALQAFAAQAGHGLNRPQVPELLGYWSNFCGVYDAVLKNGAAPASAVKQAYDAMKIANGK